MRVASRMGYGDGFLKSVERVVKLEEVGLDVVWVAEAYGNDAATRLGYLAARTHRVELASGIFPIYSRTPALLAQTAAGLDEISDGRAILGLGASGPQVIEGWHGVPYDRPVQRTREIIDICRMVWRREEVRYDGRVIKLPLPADQGTGLGKALKILTHPARSRIPIYLASMGDRSVELTAEVAEGWLPIFFVPEKADSIWGKALRRGAAKRAADLGPLEIAAGGTLAIGVGLEGLRDLARPNLALYVGGMGARDKNFYNDLVRLYGYEQEAREIQDLYLSGQKKAAEALVPAELLESLSLIGPEGYVKDRIAAFKAAGVTLLDLQPIGPDPIGDVAKVKEWVS
ncbi:MAG TPA: LLM class F420-dependent oxidoreductase [Chloroflexota bacterium]|nr:LLM class F420-dependent oxidoreductase [Chloroflexota bacterium]